MAFRGGFFTTILQAVGARRVPADLDRRGFTGRFAGGFLQALGTAGILLQEHRGFQARATKIATHANALLKLLDGSGSRALDHRLNMETDLPREPLLAGLQDLHRSAMAVCRDEPHDHSGTSIAHALVIDLAELYSRHFKHTASYTPGGPFVSVRRSNL